MLLSNTGALKVILISHLIFQPLQDDEGGFFFFKSSLSALTHSFSSRVLRTERRFLFSAGGRALVVAVFTFLEHVGETWDFEKLQIENRIVSDCHRGGHMTHIILRAHYIYFSSVLVAFGQNTLMSTFMYLRRTHKWHHQKDTCPQYRRAKEAKISWFSKNWLLCSLRSAEGATAFRISTQSSVCVTLPNRSLNNVNNVYIYFTIVYVLWL